jgi:hypothetical protein
MKISLKQTINDLAGKPLKTPEGELTLGGALSNILLGSKTKGGMKIFLLAKKCFTDKELEVDSADLSLIKNEVKTSETYEGVLVTGQVELLLEEVKEK